MTWLRLSSDPFEVAFAFSQCSTCRVFLSKSSRTSLINILRAGKGAF